VKRLFLALNIPDAVKNALLAFQPKPGAGLRPVNREGLHLTLCFIGVAEIEPVHRAVRTLHARGFPLQIKGLGQYRHAKGGALWAGVEPGEALLTLQRGLSVVLGRAHIQTGAKPFRPHITLARYKVGVSTSGIERFLQQSDRLVLDPIRIHQFVLYSSDTRPEGAVYRIEHRYPLAGIGKKRSS